MNTLTVILKTIGFIFGGFGASWFFSWFYFKKGVSTELNKLACKVLEKMVDTGLTYSLVLHKDTYTKEEVQKIVEEKVNEIIDRRNIQLKQFSEDIIKGN